MDGSLFLISRADIFSIYPRIFKELLANDDADRQVTPSGRLPKDFFNLPSDYEWKLKVYFRLLDMQRKLNEAEEAGGPPMKLDTLREVQLWDDSHAFIHLTSKGRIALQGQPIRNHLDDPMKFIDTAALSVWDLSDIAKAGMLLRRPRIPCCFENEHEMRRVYSLIYDVFRFKIVLTQALKDASFLVKYEQLKEDITRVWLLLFDLHLRHFEQRDPEETTRKLRLFKEADLLEIDSCLWTHRVRLAAALSRLRIKNGTLSLCELLPPHLQDEKVAIATANPLVSGWINPFVFRTKEQFMDFMRHQMGIEEVQTLETSSSLQFDPVCPLFVQCLPENRGAFAQTELVKKFQLVLQDRAFSIGPAICSRLLDVFEICGDVVQTHVNSPRSTAYLAGLFMTNSRIKDFMAFGAGKRVHEYRQFMKDLGITNIRVFAENFTELSLKSNLLERTVGVFATPPNSYSGVSDPIDLICSRGGDLTMLEVLTESEISDSGKTRVAQVLQEQRETLRLSMSRPQIQFILYETHSVVSSENEEMVERAVGDINRAVNLKHYYAHKERLRQEALAAQQDNAFIPGQSPTATPNSSRKKMVNRLSVDHQMGTDVAISDSEEEGDANSADEEGEEDEASDYLDEDGRQTGKSLLSSKRSNATISIDEDPSTFRQPVNVPPTDLFEVVDLPDVCLNQDQCLKLKEHGCFLSLIKRTEVTKFDSKYLIKMAETRGLFGDSKPKATRTKVNKKQEQKEAEERVATRKLKRKKSDISVLINRLTTPTLAFLNQTHFKRRSSAMHKVLYYDPIRCRCLRYLWLNGQNGSCGDGGSRSIGGWEFDDVVGNKGTHAFYSQAEERASRWWRDTVEFLKRLSDLRRKYRFKNLFQPVRDQKIRKLRLPRTVKEASTTEDNGSSLLQGKRYAHSQPATRIPFPLSVSYLELDQCSRSLVDFSADDIDLEDILRMDQLQQPRSVVHYMTQYIKQGVEEPVYYSLFY